MYECPNGGQVISAAPVYVTNEVRGDPHPDGHEGTEVKFFPISALPSEMRPPVSQVIEDFLH